MMLPQADPRRVLDWSEAAHDEDQDTLPLPSMLAQTPHSKPVQQQHQQNHGSLAPLQALPPLHPMSAPNSAQTPRWSNVMSSAAAAPAAASSTNGLGSPARALSPLDSSELSVDLSRELGQLSCSGSEAEDDDDAELRDYAHTHANNNSSILSSPSAAVSRTASNRATPNSQQHSQQHLSFYAAPGSHSPLPLGWGEAYNAAGAPAYSSLLAWDEEAIQLPAAVTANNVHMHMHLPAAAVTPLDTKQQHAQQLYSEHLHQQQRPLPAASKKPLMLHQQAWPLNSQQLDLLLSEAEQYDLRV
jgi:hypothetical protein